MPTTRDSPQEDRDLTRISDEMLVAFPVMGEKHSWPLLSRRGDEVTTYLARGICVVINVSHRTFFGLDQSPHKYILHSAALRENSSTLARDALFNC